MTQKTAAEIVATLTAIFPYYNNQNPQIMAETYYRIFADFPDELVTEAFKECIQSCDRAITPADIFGRIKTKYAPSIEEKWAELYRILWKVERLAYDAEELHDSTARRRIGDIYETMPRDLRRYVGGQGELIRMSWLTEDDLIYEKSRFMKSFEPEITTTEIVNAFQLEANNRKMLEEGKDV